MDGHREDQTGIVEFAALVTEHLKVPVITVTGEVDLHSAPRFKAAVNEAISVASEEKCVVLDLTRVEFMDSTGLGVLIGRYRELKEAGGELRIVLQGGPIRHLLKMTGLEGVFDVFETRDDAVANCTGKEN